MSLDEEYTSLKETFHDVARGHIQKFLQGFAVTEKSIRQQEDETEDLSHDILKSFKDFLKKMKSACFRSDVELCELQSKVIFFVQKICELHEAGLPTRAERRIFFNQQLCFSYAE